MEIGKPIRREYVTPEPVEQPERKVQPKELEPSVPAEPVPIPEPEKVPA